jgi:Tol biopolymer transport system component
MGTHHAQPLAQRPACTCGFVILALLLAGGCRKPVAVDDGEALGASNAGPYGPEPQPETPRLAFVRHTGQDTDIYRVRADGTGLVQLTSGPAADSQPAWSPDGSKLAFARTVAGPRSSLPEPRVSQTPGR